MPAASVHCPSCQAGLRLPENYKPGSRARCPKCGTPVVLRAPPRDDTHTAVSGNGSYHEPTDGPEPRPEETTYLEAPRSQDELGRLGPYRILHRIGVGGMGVVYEAEDTQLRRHVAIKIMLQEHAADRTAMARFIREARAQAAVEHEHVASIFIVGEDQAVPYLVMPLLRGQTLHDALKAHPNPPGPEIVRIGREMAEGLAAAHALGLIHRDIKPANVYLEGARRKVKILDFGLARAVVDSNANVEDSEVPRTLHGVVVGTPSYMSPEQAQGAPVDARTDLWSLGIVLYQMATGAVPFRASTPMGTLMAVATEPLVPPSKANPAIPQVLSNVIVKLLAKDAGRRAASAAAIAEELAEIEAAQAMAAFAPPVAANNPWSSIDGDAGEVIHKPSIPHVPSVTSEPQAEAVPRSPRRKLMVSGAVAVVLAIAGIAAAFMSGGGNPSDQAKAPETPAPTPPASKSAPKPTAPTQWKLTPVLVVNGPSPLDRLDPAQIPAAERYPWQPKELVAVVGPHQQRIWYYVNRIVASPDGKLLAIAGQDGARLLDANNFREIARLDPSVPSNSLSPATLIFSPDSRKLAAWFHNKESVVWDVRNPAQSTVITSLPHPERVLAFTHDSTAIITSSADGTVSIRDVEDPARKPIQTIPLAKMVGGYAALCKEGKSLFVLHSDSKLRRWEIAADGVKDSGVVCDFLKWCKDPTDPVSTNFTFAPRQDKLALHGTDNRSHLLELSSSAPRDVIFGESHSNSSVSFAFNPDATRVARAWNDRVELWDVTGEPKLIKFWLVSDFVRVAFAADGKSLYTAYRHPHGGPQAPVLRRWDVADEVGKELAPVPLTPRRGRCCFLDDGRLAVNDSCDGLQIWNLQAAAPELVAKDLSNPLKKPNSGAGMVVYQPDTKTLACAAAGNRLALFDLSRPEPRFLREAILSTNLNRVLCPDGRRIVLPSTPPGVVLFDASGNSMIELEKLATNFGNFAKFSPSGRFLFATSSGNAPRSEVWEILRTPAREYGTIPGGAIACSSDDRMIAYATEKGAIRLITIEKSIFKPGLELVGERPNSPRIVRQSFTPQGHRLASVDEGGQLTLRSVSDGSVVKVIHLPALPDQIEFAPDGRHLAVIFPTGTWYMLRLDPEVKASAPAGLRLPVAAVR